MHDAAQVQPLPGGQAMPDAAGQGWVTSPGKRVFDVVLAILALFIASPVLIVAAVLVKLTSRGPVLFRQVRIGRHGQPFLVVKLRTMCSARPGEAVSVTSANDKRITPVGRVLRKYKIDELPQLLNVLRGEMSFVGPRPFVPQQNPAVFSCRPGLTGAGSLAFRHQEHVLRLVHPCHLVQVHDEVLLRHRTVVDRDYMLSSTLASDLNVIVQTVLAVLGVRKRTSFDVDLRQLVASWTSATERRAAGANGNRAYATAPARAQSSGAGVVSVTARAAGA